MTAAVVRGHDRPFELEEIRLGPLRPDEVLVAIAGVGMCHTDLIVRAPDFAARLSPVILGHEGAGVVEAVGDAVTLIAPGDRVVLSYDACGHCANCLSGRRPYCVEFVPRNLSGRRTDGTGSATDSAGAPVQNRWFGQSSFATHAVATERNVVVVDDDLPIEILGPLGCGIQTGAGSVLNEMRLAAGQSLVVFGAGAVGLSAIMAAKIAGASDIVAVDLHAARRETALEVGATRVVDGAASDLTEQLGLRGGFDFALDTTGVGSVMRTAIESLKVPGMCVLVAAADEFSVPPLSLSGKTVTFALEGGSVPQVFIPKLIEYWRAGLLPIEKLVRRYPLSDIDQAEADTRSGATIKPILLP